MSDLNIKDAEGKEKKVLLTLSVRQLEEVGDFNENDDIELKFTGVVRKAEIPPAATPKEGEKPEVPDYNENPDLLKPDRYVTIELLTGEVLNKKEERKKAESLDLKPEEVQHIKNKMSERAGKE